MDQTIHRDKSIQLFIHREKEEEKTRTSQCPPRGKAPAVAEPAMLASAAAVALTTTEVLETLLDLGAKTEAACAFPAGEPRREMHDGIARARGAIGERRGRGVEDDVADDEENDDDEDDEARPPQEAAAAARAAIFLFFLSRCWKRRRERERASVRTHTRSEGPPSSSLFRKKKRGEKRDRSFFLARFVCEPRF